MWAWQQPSYSRWSWTVGTHTMHMQGDTLITRMAHKHSTKIIVDGSGSSGGVGTVEKRRSLQFSSSRVWVEHEQDGKPRPPWLYLLTLLALSSTFLRLGSRQRRHNIHIQYTTCLLSNVYMFVQSSSKTAILKVKAFTGKLPATGSQWALVSRADLPLSADGSGDSACCLLSPALGEAPPIGPLRTDGLPRSLAPRRDPAARGGDDYHFIKQT